MKIEDWEDIPFPEWEDLGPKAKALILSLTEYDDWYGSVVDVVREARAQQRAETCDHIRASFHMDVPKAASYRVDPGVQEQIEALEDQLNEVLELVKETPKGW